MKAPLHAVLIHGDRSRNRAVFILTNTNIVIIYKRYI